MSYGSTSGTPPARSRHVPSRATPATPPSINTDSHNDYFSPRRNSAAFESGLYKRTRRGKSPHDIVNHADGVISSEERSGQFDGIPIDEKEIAKLPRKVSDPLPSHDLRGQRQDEADVGAQLRGYYEHLALVHQHYLEVDSLLAGELPSAIVQSFAGRNRPEWGGDEDEDGGGSQDITPGWIKQSSSWKVQKKRDSIENVLGNGTTDLNDEERDVGGESSRLLPDSIEAREARRERVARLALNSASLAAMKQANRALGADTAQSTRLSTFCW